MMERQRKKNKKKRKALVIILILAIAAAVLLLLWINGILGGRPVFVVDENAGAVGEIHPEDLQAQLQKSVDESMFSFRINSAPEFENGSAEGNLMIENPTYNTYYMQVTITLDKTGETVYETDVLKPGTAIALDTLDRELPKGEYPATALITAYDAGTQEKTGQTAAGLTITVLE